MKRPRLAFLTLLLLAIRSWFTRRVWLEAENLLVRQQLVVVPAENALPTKFGTGGEGQKRLGAVNRRVPRTVPSAAVA
jgi:hypothetical protein